MKKFRFHIFAVALLVAFAGVFSACSDDDDDKNPAPNNDPVTLTQARLDTMTTVFFNDNIGPTVVAATNDTVPLPARDWKGVLAPGATPPPSDVVYRKLYRNFGRNVAPKTGDLAVVHGYVKDSLGNNSASAVVLAMMKQPAGYFSTGGDFEYISIDPSTVSAEHPNGLLSTVVFRGKKTECSDCHSRAGSDFLFSN